MTDDLRTRIAAALFARAMSRLAWHRSWDALQPEVQQTWLDDADAVIRELGLKREDWNEGYSDRYRHVTGWRS